ncbi:D-alanyl-D-alanine carboxypeptidase family protein [Labrenzia sp. PHM005]|uniref:D-alanyl-D-alanine carboxypeptidase family protein n=1 Tax=Labrenzia sp. PHM005 TaxID=2590016 RepID=UPI0011405B27|nr:D-alanyl-D-alanine carboxypeptidase family protein [Labrenzia sp. PHM005]QDG77188.1 D-alanyl-D-alanine carboxypeptidase [Labrenzia sp. PHM005]
MRCLFAIAILILAMSPRALLATPSLVVDLDTGAVLHSEDAGHRWYPASTTKLMTALVTFEALANNEIDLKTPVILSHQAMRQRWVKTSLKVGSAMSLEDALYAVLVSSANNVAVALAETVAGSEDAFVARMNAAAERLGLTASHFTNPNGLFDRKQTVSARDLALLSIELYQKYPQYHAIYTTAAVQIDGQDLKSYNNLLTRFPGTLGLKTGFVCPAGRNIAAVAERDGRRILTVVLGATTGRERSERTAKLFTEAFDGTLVSKGTVLKDLANTPDTPPEDMRLRLCSDQTAVYEAKQDKLYPWGLPGKKSYLADPVPARRHTIKTWFVPQPEFVPKPRAKPDRMLVTSAWSKVSPPPKPNLKLN